jgi:hypothetical protein
LLYIRLTDYQQAANLNDLNDANKIRRVEKTISLSLGMDLSLLDRQSFELGNFIGTVWKSIINFVNLWSLVTKYWGFFILSYYARECDNQISMLLSANRFSLHWPRSWLTRYRPWKYYCFQQSFHDSWLAVNATKQSIIHALPSELGRY